MPWGFPRGENVCKSTSRQTGGPCKRAAVPFGDFCIFHGGNRADHRAKVKERFERYLAGWHPEHERPDSPEMRRRKIEAYLASEERYQRRLMKKNGTLADWEAESKRQADEDKRRRSAERQRREEQGKAERENGPGKPVRPPRPASGVEVGEVISYGLGWADWGEDTSPGQTALGDW
jgi:hypothetical protein